MDKFDMIIQNGRIATAGEAYTADIGIKDGKVACVAKRLERGTKIIDASGKYVLPGAVDIHTHIDAPLHGSHTLDDWYQGTCAAAFGGVTCVVDYPNQIKGQSVRNIIEQSHGKARDKAVIDYSFSPVIVDRTEAVYAELPQLIEEGFPTYKVFMAYDFKIHDEELVKLLDVIAKNGGLLGVHCENDWAIGYMADQLVKAGKTQPKYHSVSRPPITEEEATGRVLRIAEMVGAPVLIVHVSAKGALREITNAKSKGVRAYGETCPHFLLLDENLYDQDVSEAAKFVVTPPLRTKEHRKALWNALTAGTISLVSSDHCAFSLKEKLRLGSDMFTKIPHGAPGVETRVPLLFSEGVAKGRININKFVELISTNPARLAGLYPRKGTIAVGCDADILILDGNREETISVQGLHGACDFTPFQGYQVKGWPETVISRGRIIVDKGQLVARPGSGRLVKRNGFQAF